MSRRTSSEVMCSTSVTTLVPTVITDTWRCVTDLVADLWRTEVLISDGPRVLLHSVLDDSDDGPGCWLTWTLTACGRGTRVELVHSEQVDGAPPELHSLLLVVLQRCIQRVTPA